MANLVLDGTVPDAVRCTRGKIVNGDKGRRIFQVRDRFNRTIGCAYSCATVEIVPAKPDAMSWYRTMKPGTYYTLWTAALRDGERYGASQAERLFLTAGERDKALEKYLADAEKRALKKEGK